MKITRRRAVLATVAAIALGTAAAAFAAPGFRTSRPAQLVAVAPGVEITPIISTGDVVPGTQYQMTGIPDGLGAFKTRGNLDVLMSHELDGLPVGVGARLSRLTLDRQGLGVLDAHYVINGSETNKYARFCSGSLAVINGTPWYFTGEESTKTGNLTDSTLIGRGGVSIAVNLDTEQVIEAPQFGRMEHENVVPIQGLRRAMILTSEDGTAGQANLYAYTARTFADALAGQGQLWVWKADISPADGNQSSNDITLGQTVAGHFEPISQSDNTSIAALELRTQAIGAFDFTRLEDIAVGRNEGSGRDRPADRDDDEGRGRGLSVFLADTGSPGAETVRGRLYRFDIDRSDPTRASLTLLVDGDSPATLGAVVNPDNIATSERSVVLQEDRNSGSPNFRQPNVAFPGDLGFSRVLVYDIASGTMQTAARVDTPTGVDPGEWESSGVINAQTLLGRDMWIVDVQSHKRVVGGSVVSATTPQPGPGGLPSQTTLGEDGQLLSIRIPGS